MFVPVFDYAWCVHVCVLAYGLVCVHVCVRIHVYVRACGHGCIRGRVYLCVLVFIRV